MRWTIRQPELHIVAKVIEAEFVIGAVGDILGVLYAPLVIQQATQNAADAEAQGNYKPHSSSQHRAGPDSHSR